MSAKVQPLLTSPCELVLSDTVGLSLGKTHLSKLKDSKMSGWLTVKECLVSEDFLQEDGCFDLQYLVQPVHC